MRYLSGLLAVGMIIFSLHGAERIDALSEASSYDSDQLVTNELEGLEIGQPQQTNIHTKVLRKALEKHVFKDKDERVRLRTLFEQQPEGFQVFENLAKALQPKKSLPETFSKTPAHVRSMPSVRLDKEMQEQMLKALEVYKLSHRVEQLQAWLSSSDSELDKMRFENSKLSADLKIVNEQLEKYKQKEKERKERHKHKERKEKREKKSKE